MSGNRLTIFDTTLRDGEQAPGFSLKIDEKLALARQLRTLGVDIIEAGFPIASESDAEAVRMVATHVQGPVIAALARCHAQGHRARRLGAGARAAPPDSRLHRHLGPAPRAEAPHLARGVPPDRDGRGPAGPESYRRRAVLGGRRDPERSRLPLPDHRGGDPGRRQDDQSAGHRRLLDARRSRATSSAR